MRRFITASAINNNGKFMQEIDEAIFGFPDFVLDVNAMIDFPPGERAAPLTKSIWPLPVHISQGEEKELE